MIYLIQYKPIQSPSKEGECPRGSLYRQLPNQTKGRERERKKIRDLEMISVGGDVFKTTNRAQFTSVFHPFLPPHCYVTAGGITSNFPIYFKVHLQIGSSKRKKKNTKLVATTMTGYLITLGHKGRKIVAK